MKKLALILMLVFAVVIQFPAASFAANELRVLIWSEYMPEDFMDNFKKDTGIKSRVELYESTEELVAKLQAGGVNQYDVVVPSDYIINTMIKLNLLQKLDHSKLPNLANLDPSFQNTAYDPGNEYTAAYQWGTVGMLYDKKKLGADYVASTALFFDPASRKGPVVMIDSIREMLGIALKYMGKSVNTLDKTDLKALADMMIETKSSKYFAGFDVGTGGRSKVVAGTAVAALVYNGDALRAVADHPDQVVFANPKEGGVIWADNMAIPAGAPHVDYAHTFINWVLDAHNGAALSNWTQYATPNKAAKEFITPEDLTNPAIYPSEETMKTLEFITDLGKDNRYYDELWTMIKTR
ncbi:spermidine/putrescine ABC transporter substrate-binding protein [uncultured Desulfobacter sp.]|uniref:polyamine ABC transporter substrate-binding protein n=1 Tax=uncultured Desulfobacter sp. TaxID=240139 RepID=UPI002AAB3A41|nr:spermidine/putrescine ABC transporter substrate-binding protein [uncultured Desulfobacter sp.]